VKGDELAAVEFVPFDDLLAFDHFADVASTGRRACQRERPDHWCHSTRRVMELNFDPAIFRC
jgi:hypothetical protein